MLCSILNIIDCKDVSCLFECFVLLNVERVQINVHYDH